MRAIAILLAAAASGWAVAPAAAASLVTEWNALALDAIRAESTAPPRAARGLAMVHAAVFDAVNSVDGTHNAYHTFLPTPGASREAAAIEAAHRVLSHLFPSQAASFDAARTSGLAGVADGPAKTAGINLGATVADNMIALRIADGSAGSGSYTPGTNPGDWQPTPPGFAPALLPHWPAVTPFVMTSGAQFRPPPPALNSPEYTAAFNEVRDLGSATSAVRTADQTDIARFWADGPGTATPPGHWNRIAATVSTQQGNTLSQDARLFALLNLALADAGIAAWDAKYGTDIDLWRPVTGIRMADLDGNIDTAAVPDWEPLLTTPPFPAYTSGHSTFSGAAAAMLAAFYGTDLIAFTSSAEGFAVGDRSFSSFSQAADEAGMSRIYGGIHWQFDNTEGLSAGGALGAFVFANALTPVPEPAALGLLLIAAAAALFVRRVRNQGVAS